MKQTLKIALIFILFTNSIYLFAQQDRTISITSGGIARKFDIHLPSINPDKNLPMIISYHGTGGTSGNMSSFTGFNLLSDLNNFIVIYPQALALLGGTTQWNVYVDDKPGHAGINDPNAPDDILFTKDMIDYMKNNFLINDSRVFATGMSNGAFMCYNLAINLRESFQAIAPVAGNLWGDNNFITSKVTSNSFRGLPIMHIHGTSDNVVDYPDPDNTPKDYEEYPLFLFSYPTCQNNTYTKVINISSGVDKLQFCDNPFDISLIRIAGMGHSWSDGKFQTSREIVKFFKLDKINIPNDKNVLQVKGRFLYTPCNDKVILRGVNKMNIWENNDFGIPQMKEISKTGANVLRIVWESDFKNKNATSSNLDRVIQACIDNKMIPMVELHDATGDFSKLNQCLNYWRKPDVLDVLKKHQSYLIINFANEAGNFDVTDAQFKEEYKNNITSLRNNGIQVPIVIDAAGYGQNIDIILNNAQYLIDNDPSKNLMFSLHAYWQPKYFNNPPNLLKQKLSESVSKNIPLIIGEFAGCYLDDPNSDDNLYKTILSECQLNQIGWLAWEWGPGNADYSTNPPTLYPKMDLTSDGNFNTIKDGWSKYILLDDINSIKKTSIISEYIINKGKCNSNSIELILNPLKLELR
jgi:mannan endo-1,4-beta-mannosidase